MFDLGVSSAASIAIAEIELERKVRASMTPEEYASHVAARKESYRSSGEVETRQNSGFGWGGAFILGLILGGGNG